MSLQLRATKHQLADLKRISALGTDRLSQVQQRLCKLGKHMLRPQDLLEAVGELLEADAEPLVRQLLSLQGLVRHSGSSVEEVISGIRGAIEQQGDEIDFDTADWKGVEDIVKALVQDQSVRLAATAIELAYDYANLLRRTKILTDIRPLFNKAGSEIEGAVVSYTLRLWYDSADGGHELSIALDESDIETLATQCNRALKKAATAKSLLAEKCSIAVTISGEANDD